MTISTFADLRAQAATYLNRSNLTSQIPIFTQLAETRIAYGSEEAPLQSEPLRIRAMETSADLTFNAQSVALPTNFVQQRRLYISGTPNKKIHYVTPGQFWDKWLSSATGAPLEYTIEGENIILGPTPDTSYTGKILYYKKFTALSADSDTNWLLTNAPGAYLQGTLLEAYNFARNPEQAQLSLNRFCGVINALNNSNKTDRYASPWAEHTDSWTP